jgi:hypothetical protein
MRDHDPQPSEILNEPSKERKADELGVVNQMADETSMQEVVL